MRTGIDKYLLNQQTLLMPDKTMKERKAGTPQGGVISPVLSNLFMHYAFDMWMAGKFPNCPWERYADDGIIHCVTREQAEFVLDMLKKRMLRFGLPYIPRRAGLYIAEGITNPYRKG